MKINFEVVAKRAMAFVKDNGTLADGKTGTLPFSASPEDVAHFFAEGCCDENDRCAGVPYDDYVRLLTAELKALKG